jgi:hypothetical protein
VAYPATIGENWIFICSVNGDNRALRWNPGYVEIPFIINTTSTYYSDKAICSWNAGDITGTSLSISGTTSAAGGLLVPRLFIGSNNQTISSAYSGGFVQLTDLANTVYLFSAGIFGTGGVQPYITLWANRGATTIRSNGGNFFGNLSSSNGATTFTLNANCVVTFASDGYNWLVVSKSG